MCRTLCVISCSHREFFSLRLGSACSTPLPLPQMLFETVLDLTLAGTIDVEAGAVIADLKSCREKIMSQRKAVKDTRERWFSAETVASSAVGESAPRTDVRISDVIEVGDVQYVAEHEKLGLPCCSRSTSSPGKSKKRRAPVSPGVVKKQFSVSSPSASRPSFESAPQKSFEKSGQESVVAIAVMPQFTGDTNNNLTAYLYKVLAFRILVIV